jgi:hypothetical protein
MTVLERFLFMGSFGIALIAISGLGLLHVGLDQSKSGYVPTISKAIRLGSRVSIALIFIFVSLFAPIDALSPLACTAIVGGLMLFQGVLEEYGRLRKD